MCFPERERSRSATRSWGWSPEPWCCSRRGVPHMVWNTGDIPLHMVCFYAPNADAIQYTFYEDFDF